MDSLEARLLRLERQNRRLRAVLYSMLMIVAAAALASAAPAAKPPADELRARAFHLVDDTGRVRASLQMAKTGPVLSLHSSEGAPCVVAEARDKGGMLHLSRPDADRDTGVFVMSSSDGDAIGIIAPDKTTKLQLP